MREVQTRLLSPRAWLKANGWRAWVAIAVCLAAIFALSSVYSEGYDITPLLWVVAFWIVLSVVAAGVVIGFGKWPIVKTALYCAAGAVIIGYAAILFGWQIIHWLRFDVWISLDIYTLLTTIGADGPRSITPPLYNPLAKAGWLISPKSWIGLHKVVTFLFSWLSLSVVALFVGLIVIGASGVDEKRQA